MAPPTGAVTNERLIAIIEATSDPRVIKDLAIRRALES